MRPLLDYLLPPSCVLCHKKILRSREILLCSTCLLQFRAACSLTFPVIDCSNQTHYYLGNYCGILQQLVTLGKFHGHKHLIAMLGAKLGHLIAAHELPWDFLVPVPIRFTSFYMRGFHQTVLLAAQIQKLLMKKIPILGVLKQHQFAKAQHLSNRKRRLANRHNLFSLRYPIPDARVLLIDDVVTTGTTLRAATDILLKGGAAHVDYAYIAATPLWHLPPKQV